MLSDVLKYFATYEPPSRGYRPTLPLGHRFGSKPLPRRQKDGDSDDEDDDR